MNDDSLSNTRLKRNSLFYLVLFLSVLLCCSSLLISQEKADTGTDVIKNIEKKVQELMEEGDIPGLTLVIVKKNEPVYVKGFGFADASNKIPVTPRTLFELASCSKAFTALAALKLEKEGLLDFDSPVSKYLPWFFVTYEGKKVPVTLRQVLHQTSGIPTSAVSKIIRSRQDDALEKTVKNVAGIELEDKPGNSYRYSTVNYDVIGAIIEKVTGKSFESYMQENILLPLGLTDTVVGRTLAEASEQPMATGHRMGFFAARPYDPPYFRGNNPAGYIITNGNDLVRWLQLQAGLVQHDMTPLIMASQQRDKSVQPTFLLSYAMGWMVHLDGSGLISHTGLNPGFSSHILFHPEEQIGVAVVANSTSNYTIYTGQAVMNMLRGKPLPPENNLGDPIDKASSVFALINFLFLILLVVFLLLFFIHLLQGKRRFEPITLGKIARMIRTLVLMVPFIGAIYLLPYLLQNVDWQTALAWAPASFKVAITLVCIALASSYLSYILSSLFPHTNKYFRSVPMLIILSLLSGSANAVVIFLITVSLYGRFKLVYLLYYFLLATCLYLLGRKQLQTRLIQLTFDIIYDLRVKLVGMVFRTSYEKFEKLDDGRVLAVLNNDTTQLGQSANFFVAVASSLITVLGAFMYLATIAFWTTIVTVAVITVVATVYSIVSQKASVLFNEARNTQNVYLGLLTGLRDGFKELSLHSAKKKSYKSDVEDICQTFRSTSSKAMIKFVNAFMVGESMLIFVLGSVGFGIPLILPDMQTATLMSYIMVLLYLIGPVNGILNSIPGIMQVRISWNRVQNLMKDIPANIPETEMEKIVEADALPAVEKIEAQGVYFAYEAEEESEKFAVGPLDFDAQKGEIVFIVGGNGSGKTTLAKMLTGLYIPEKGSITINGKKLDNYELGEYFSVVFGDFHLFEKFYDVDLSGKEELVDKYLDMLRLKEKVKVEDNAFSTVELSAGQRKRLALLRCYLEDRPIYLFDEIAADQDPQFRKFFYRNLLMKMKEDGKVVIAITHDDHYFDVADRVIKMDMGKIDIIGKDDQLIVTK